MRELWTNVDGLNSKAESHVAEGGYTAEILVDSSEATAEKLFASYKVLNEAICRNTLISILSALGPKVNDSSR